MNRSPIYTLLNHILPPTHSYKLAQIISIKEIIKKISSCNKYTYCHTKKKKRQFEQWRPCCIPLRPLSEFSWLYQMISSRVWALAQNSSTLLNNAWHKALPSNSELQMECSVKAGESDPHQIQSLGFIPRDRIKWGWSFEQHSRAAPSRMHSYPRVLSHKLSRRRKRAAVVKRRERGFPQESKTTNALGKPIVS